MPNRLLKRLEMRPTQHADAVPLCALINAVCHERRYLCTVQGFTLAQTQCYLTRVLEASFPHFLAEQAENIIGWCDIAPTETEGFTHVGRLGMGIAAGYRSQGLGRRLLRACLTAAYYRGLEKIELEVYDDNASATHLYTSEGFVTEGLRRRARKLDGCYQDIRLMGLFLSDWTNARSTPKI